MTPTIYDLANLQQIQTGLAPLVALPAAEAELNRQQLLQQMAMQREIGGRNIIDAAHMQRARENALAEMAMQQRFQSAEGARRDAADLAQALAVQEKVFQRTKELEEGRDSRLTKQIKADREAAEEKEQRDRRKALEKFFRDRGVNRKEGETDEQFEERGFTEVRKSHRNQIVAHDRAIDSITKQTVAAAEKMESERQRMIESEARASLGITPQNAHIELKKPGMAEMLAQQRMQLQTAVRPNPSYLAEISSLKNQLARTTEAREGLVKRFSEIGGSDVSLYADTPLTPEPTTGGLNLSLPDEEPAKPAAQPKPAVSDLGVAPRARTSLNSPPPITSSDEFNAFKGGLPGLPAKMAADRAFYETFANQFGLPDQTRGGAPYLGMGAGILRGTALKTREQLAREMLAQHPELVPQFKEFEVGDATARESENFFHELRNRLRGSAPY